MSSVRSGPQNAEWVKQRDTAHDISCGTADIKSGADYGEKEVKEAGNVVEDINGDEDDAEKSTKETVWDQTKGIAEDIADVAGNVSHSAYNIGSDLCGAVKHGWNKVADK